MKHIRALTQANKISNANFEQLRDMVMGCATTPPLALPLCHQLLITGVAMVMRK